MDHLRALKCEAKRINRLSQVNVYRFTLLFWVITLVLNAISRYFNRAALADSLALLLSRVDLPAAVSSVYDSILAAAASGPAFSPAVITFVSVFVFLFNCLLGAGYTIYILGVRRGEQMDCGTLFDGFAFAGKILALELLRTLLLAVWSTLFIVPGIIISYRYSFALYNLLENPDLSVLDAMALSRQQTQGRKWQLFVLDLSFLGWNILTVLTAGILAIYVKPYRSQTWVGCFYAAKASAPNDPLPPQDPSENESGL